MVWHQYNRALMQRPLLVKATTAATLMSISDLLCQTYEQQQQRRSNDDEINCFATDYNWKRFVHVGLTGLSFSGPISHFWYQLLEDLVEAAHRHTRIIDWNNSITDMALKLFLDAILFSPIAVAGYFIWRSALEGSNVPQKLKQKWWSALQASWSFWPVANIVNFGVVPLHYRVLYNNGLSLLWNAYLSNLNGRTTKDDELMDASPPALEK